VESSGEIAPLSRREVSKIVPQNARAVNRAGDKKKGAIVAPLHFLGRLQPRYFWLA
jgi:hypothetical protein